MNPGVAYLLEMLGRTLAQRDAELDTARADLAQAMARIAELEAAESAEGGPDG